jgi:Ca2+-binding EF-hand superfamily protein
MKHTNSKTQFVICVNNQGYLASLELRKVYRVLPDDKAAKHRLIRIIDESGEDYLFPADFFIAIDLPEAVEKAVSAAA